MREAAGGALAQRRSPGKVGAPRLAFRLGSVPAGFIVLCAGLALAGCAPDWARLPARGELQGHAIDTTVDAEIARYYLEHYLPRRQVQPALDRRIEQALAELPAAPSREAFRDLSEALSVDLATMHLIEVLAEDPANARARFLFRRELERIRGLRRAGGGRLAACVRASELPALWFAPGWFYRSNPGTGADFARQRALLERLGVDVHLIPVVENGTVEGNATIIAEEIRQLEQAGERVILVSASKGGPEVAHALGHVLEPEATRTVRAWINVGGLLKGAPLADWASAWPQSWLAGLYYGYQGLDPAESIASLTTGRSRARFARQTVPEHILVVNFVAVPLSGQISPGAEFGYARTRRIGPNDGLTAIVDQLAHGGMTILQVGLDHYYRDPQLDLKTLALALTVMLELGHPLPEACAL
ncbi:MAG: hypothetical protein ACREJ5_21605 [Geminicoccaceae bacterium]